MSGRVHPSLKAGLDALKAVARNNGHGLQVTSTRRSRAEQRRLYNAWLAGRSQYPAAAPGTSAHEFGWAFDAVVAPAAMQSAYGALWQRWGGVWGGERDPVHFQLRVR